MNAKRPTLAQKKLLVRRKLDPSMWLVVRETQDHLELVHRYGDKTRKTVPKIGGKFFGKILNSNLRSVTSSSKATIRTAQAGACPAISLPKRAAIW